VILIESTNFSLVLIAIVLVIGDCEFDNLSLDFSTWIFSLGQDF
jgi:hypothetical protein